MLDIQLIRDEPNVVRRAFQVKGLSNIDLVDRLLELDAEWRETSTKLQDLKTRLNQRGRRIGELMKSGRKEEAQQLVEENSASKKDGVILEELVRDLTQERENLLLEMPNVPHVSVPEGAGADDNVEQLRRGSAPEFDFPAHPHWNLVESRGLVDFARGAKVTGAGFPFYIGWAARLQRALVQFFLDRAREAGYVEIQAPVLVNAESATATGQLPDKEDIMYEITRDGLFAIPTAEVPITNFLRDEILEDLPVRYAGYTPCFRREAGSYGKDVRGLNRLHQFDKVELVAFVHPDESYDVLEEMTEHAEQLLDSLELSYRRMLMCTGDMGFTQAKKYDLEVWSPGQERWLEVSSISNFEAFQARRAAVRFRESEGAKPQYVHTLNGSALALPRVVAALLETGQRKDGSLTLPGALSPYIETEFSEKA